VQRLAYLDFETYSEAGYVWNGDTQRGGPLPGATKPGLPAIGVAKYVEHPSTLPLMLSYAFDDGPVVTWRVGDVHDPYDLLDHIERGGLVSGWNVSFEWWVWNEICVPRWGWPVLPIRQCRCTMGRARAHALPGALGKCAEVLGLPIQKADSKWMKRFCMPRNPTKADPRRRIGPRDDPAGFEELVRYNVTDVEAERAIAQRVPELSDDELEYWFCDFEMNARGVQIDVAGVDACINVVEGVLAKADAEMATVTGGAVERTSQLERLKEWLGVSGSLDEDAITEWLKTPLTPPTRRALELRQMAGSASVKKVFAMRNQVTSKGRLHNMWLYHGARTGRPTGSGPQPTNLPNSGPGVYQCPACSRWYGTHTAVCPWCSALRGPAVKAQEWNPAATVDALQVISAGSSAVVEWFFGHALNTVSGCLRALFVAAPGHELVSSDYNSIEAVVAACLAGEQWRIDVFRTHGRIYEVSAAKITGIPFDEATVHPHRKRGKVAELASAYQGWVGSWLKFGAGEFMKEEEIKDAILAWRAESPAIIHLWGAIQNAAHWAVMQPNIPFPVTRRDGSSAGLTYRYDDVADVLYCVLPSGRPLSYHRPRLATRERYGRAEQSLSFEGWNSNPKNGPTGWLGVDTWGGRLFQNVCQAVAGDVQRYSIVTAERNNYAVVMNVYDEQVCEVPEGAGRVNTMEQFMGDLPEWCRDWPIRASGGWVGERYR